VTACSKSSARQHGAFPVASRLQWLNTTSYCVDTWIDIGFFHSFITYIPQGMGNLLLSSGIRAEGMLCAEKKCRKLAMGNVDFSPAVDMAKKRWWLWQQVVKKREGKRISSALLK
jgi:hypothetical protein